MSDHNEDHKFSFNEFQNTAQLKYNAAEPLTAEEACAIAGVDMDTWMINRQKVNMWQMGRKDRHVNLDYVDGVSTGIVEDSGEIKKTYLYQIWVELIRIDPVAITPTLQPIVINNYDDKNIEIKEEPPLFGLDTRILFITDPHFGFKEEGVGFQNPVTFHSRKFLSDLLALASKLHELDYVVWGGDTLDLADFSTFPKDPSIILKTQAAAIEAAWVINEFQSYSKESVVLEGNHDARLRKATKNHLTAAYDLKAVNDLDGDPLLSMSKLLGIDDAPYIHWIGGYPNEMWDVGDLRFIHGDTARQDSGANVVLRHKSGVHSTIFGHIHRYEIATKRVDGIKYPTVMATPGCACRWQHVPGAKRNANWQIGAFYITLDRGHVANIEHISHIKETTYFRGDCWVGRDYAKKMKKDDVLPSKYINSL